MRRMQRPSRIPLLWEWVILRCLGRMSGSIFQFSGASLLGWTSAYALWEPVSYFLIRAMSSARTVGEYYDPARMPVPVVFFGDYIYSTFILLIAQQVIGRVLGAAASWLGALAVFLGVQWVSDFLFYLGVTALPRGTSRYVDFFQRYTKEVGVGALVGDSLYGIVWLALSQALMNGVPAWGQLVAIVLFLFGTLMVSY